MGRCIGCGSVRINFYKVRRLTCKQSVSQLEVRLLLIEVAEDDDLEDPLNELLHRCVARVPERKKFPSKLFENSVVAFRIVAEIFPTYLTATCSTNCSPINVLATTVVVSGSKVRFPWSYCPNTLEGSNWASTKPLVVQFGTNGVNFWSIEPERNRGNRLVY